MKARTVKRIKSGRLNNGHLLYMRKLGRFYRVQAINPHTGEIVVEIETTKRSVADRNYDMYLNQDVLED